MPSERNAIPHGRAYGLPAQVRGDAVSRTRTERRRQALRHSNDRIASCYRFVQPHVALPDPEVDGWCETTEILTGGTDRMARTRQE